MSRARTLSAVLFAAGLGLAAAACCSRAATDNEAMLPRPGRVTDMAAFEQFIATRPTPEGFHRRYPDVMLVLPGQMATKELRLDRSRYFAELDAQGRIQGGAFK